MDELLFDENYIVFLQNQSLDTLCSLYYEVHNQLMDIIHTHKGEEDYKIITAKRAVIEGTIMSKVMQEHGYKIVAKNPHACMWDESHISLDIYLEK
ncbi:hypothetical protein [Catenibacterium sp.]|uniref:hypothetical protein n=1 Tax=Catenibacterium sp. TaxID=2049022 RepID=UPI003AF129F4